MLAQVQAELTRLQVEDDVPGVSVCIVSGDHIVEASAGIVNNRTGVAVTADTLFPIQSVTKIVTATLVMQLVDEGSVGLDDPVRAHLPDFRTADVAASGKITVRHLLTHTGGFEGDLWQATTSGDDALELFVGDLVGHARQYSPPGGRFSYCNAGFGVLGRLVEVTRGTTFEAAVRRCVTDPLGTDELAFSADQALAFRTAIGHVHSAPSAALRPTRVWAPMPPSNPAAGNQLAMSARGLARLGRMFASGGRAASGDRILSAESVAAMLNPQLRQRESVPYPTDQGLGWRLPRPRVAEHGGGAPGIAAMLTIVPDRRLTAVVLTNSDGGARLIRRLLAPLLHDLADVPPAPDLPVPDPALRAANPSHYQGLYADRQRTIEVTVDGDGRLWHVARLQHEGAELVRRVGLAATAVRHELRPLGSDTFVLADAAHEPAGTITFLDRDSEGRCAIVADDRVAARRS